MPLARLFVAAIPPPEVLDRIAAVPRPPLDRVRWTTRDQWHVTLRFLGAAVVTEAEAAVRAVAGAGSALVAQLGPAAGELGHGVVVLPVAGLDELAAAIAAATVGIGEPPSNRAFRGHLTLARCRARARPSLAELAIDASFAIDEIHLVRSDTRPEGARYRILATHQL